MNSVQTMTQKQCSESKLSRVHSAPNLSLACAHRLRAQHALAPCRGRAPPAVSQPHAALSERLAPAPSAPAGALACPASPRACVPRAKHPAPAPCRRHSGRIAIQPMPCLAYLSAIQTKPTTLSKPAVSQYNSSLYCDTVG